MDTQLTLTSYSPVIHHPPGSHVPANGHLCTASWRGSLKITKQIQYNRIISALLCNPEPMTRDQLCRAANLKGNSLRPRIRELLDQGTITIAGMGTSDEGNPSQTITLNTHNPHIMNSIQCDDLGALRGETKMLLVPPINAAPLKTPQ